MADYLIHDSTLEDIADAIRSKTGGSSLIEPEDMPTEIASISGGGGITDGVVVNSVNANNRITSVTKYGQLHPFEFGVGSKNYKDYCYGYLEELTLTEDTIAADNSLRSASLTTINGLEYITGCGSGAFQDVTIPSITLPNATTFGSTAFRSITSTEVILPKFSDGNNFIFQSATSLQNVQLGSVGNAVTAQDKQWFYGCSQTDLTVTVYTTGSQADNMVTYIRRNATNATIIIKASEATTYNGTSYSAGDTILTSEVTS